jgi:predicted nucleic acid-binding protein
VPENKKIKWGNREYDVVSYKPGVRYPNEKLKKNNLEFYNEVNLLPKVAFLGLWKRVQFVYTREVDFERGKIPWMMNPKYGKFYNAPLAKLKSPITADFATREFEKLLQSIEHPRLNELKKITNASQGNHKIQQLYDAYHIWSAEYNNCDYFLTLDKKLHNSIRNRKKYPLKVEIVYPSDLIKKFMPIHHILLKLSEKLGKLF